MVLSLPEVRWQCTYTKYGGIWYTVYGRYFKYYMVYGVPYMVYTSVTSNSLVLLIITQNFCQLVMSSLVVESDKMPVEAEEIDFTADNNADYKEKQCS